MMTYDKIMEIPTTSRAEKLVATYYAQPSRLSRAFYSLIDAYVHAHPALRQRIVNPNSIEEGLLPDIAAAVEKQESGELLDELEIMPVAA
jgi:hypothetical protein